MFRLSKGAEYAIRGVLHLTLQPRGKVTFIDEIAAAQGVPKAYLAKIFQFLSKKGFLKSTRGAGGGFMLARDPGEITLLDVIEAMEGPIHLNDCLIHKDFCERVDTCPVHDVWREAQKKFLESLSSCTFEKLARSPKLKREKKVTKKR